jgi:dihydrofolate reductase
MRLVLLDFMSLDGVCQAPGGPEEDLDNGFAHGGWWFRHMDLEVIGDLITETTNDADALLFGRRTYDGMAAAWPGRAGDPHADAMNAIRKYVVSRTYTAGDLTWTNSHLLAGDALRAIATLMEQPGRELQMWGSTSLAQELIAADLVDEYVLMVAPVLLGGGKSIFPTDGAQRLLRLVSLTPTSTGAFICRLAPERAAAEPAAVTWEESLGARAE